MTRDRQLEVYARFDAELRTRLRALVTPEIVAEHARAPFGPHSDALARIENYFRRSPTTGKYIVIAVEPWSDYRIGTLSGVRGESARVLPDSDRYLTESAAAHGIFLRRVRDLTQGIAA
jgi:branched-chain amino acid transport system permease protein